MSPLVFLYAVTLVPLDTRTEHGQALFTSREAALIQSGVKADFELLKGAAEKRIPPVIRHAGVVAGVVYNRQLILHDRRFGTWHLKPDSVRATFVLEW